MSIETQKQFQAVQIETVKTMDHLSLTIAKMNSYQRFHYLNKIRNFLDLIDLD